MSHIEEALFDYMKLASFNGSCSLSLHIGMLIAFKVAAVLLIELELLIDFSY